jgi:DNA-binding beta-propeller fold protein YncE
LATGGVPKIDAAPDQFIEDVVISPDGRYAYMTGESLIATTKTIVARNTDVGDGRARLAISPDGTRANVVGFATPRVSVIALQAPADPAIAV